MKFLQNFFKCVWFFFACNTEGQCCGCMNEFHTNYFDHTRK